MAWLHAKLQYINSEWYKTENKTRVHIIIINIRELWGWILKYFLKGVLFFFFWHVWDFVKTSGKPKEISSLSERKKAALECTAVARRTTNKTTWSHLWEQGVTYERKLVDKKKSLYIYMSNYETQQQQPSCRVIINYNVT